MKSRILFLAVLLAMIPVAVFFVDAPCSQFFRGLNMQVFVGKWTPPAEEIASRVPEDIREIFVCIEIFGNKIGVIAMIGLCMLLGRRCHRNWPLMLGSVVGSAVVGHVLKRCIVRVRPFAFDFQNAITESFGGLSVFANSEDITQSFPSGHTVAAVALAVVLAWLYPRKRFVFYGLAAWLMTYRIAIGAHYLSDTLAACFIAVTLTWLGIFIWQRIFGRAWIFEGERE